MSESFASAPAPTAVAVDFGCKLVDVIVRPKATADVGLGEEEVVEAAEKEDESRVTLLSAVSDVALHASPWNNVEIMLPPTFASRVDDVDEAEAVNDVCIGDDAVSALFVAEASKEVVVFSATPRPWTKGGGREDFAMFASSCDTARAARRSRSMWAVRRR